MYYKDEGIILNFHNSTDADKIVIIFLKKYGKTSFVFKGIRKSKSKKLNSADIGNYVDLYYYKKNEQLPVIREIKVKNHFYSIKKDHIKYLYLHYISELFLNILLPEEANIKVFNLLLKILITFKDISLKDLEKFIVYIEYRLIQVTGILPDFRYCVMCHEKKEHFYYNCSKDELVCDQCKDDNNIYETMIDMKILGYIDKIHKHTIMKISDLEIDEESIIIMDKIFKNIIYKYLNKEMKSDKILKKIMKDIKCP